MDAVWHIVMELVIRKTVLESWYTPQEGLVYNEVKRENVKQFNVSIYQLSR